MSCCCTRFPVSLLSWLNRTRFASVVAGTRATGQLTRDRRRNPLQLARGMALSSNDHQRSHIGSGTATVKIRRDQFPWAERGYYGRFAGNDKRRGGLADPQPPRAAQRVLSGTAAIAARGAAASGRRCPGRRDRHYRGRARLLCRRRREDDGEAGEPEL